MRKSSSGSEGFADYDDQSNDSKSSNGDSDNKSSGEYMADNGDSQDSEEVLQMPTLMRMTSMQIGNEYSYVVIN